MNHHHRLILRSLFLDLMPLRRSRDFALLSGSQLLSVWTRQVILVAMPYQIYVATRSSLDVGLLGIMQTVPMIVSGLYGGGLIDRFDRKNVQIAGKALAAAASLLLVLNALLRGSVSLIFVISVIGTAGYSISQSARAASVPRLVDRDLLPAALSIGQVLQNGGAIIGPVLGGFFIAVLGLPWAYAVDVIAFVPAVLFLRALSPLPAMHASIARGWRAPAEGLRFVRQSQMLKAILIADLNATVFGMPTAIFPALALSVFRVGPTGLGLLYAAPAVGALLGALFSGWVSRVEAQGRFIIWSIGIWGLAIGGFGLLGDVRLLGLLLLAIAGAADMVSAVFRQAILQLSVPDHLRGRVSSLNSMVTTTGPQLGNFEAGTVAALTSPVISVVSGGVLSVIGIVVVVLAFPSLRHYRRHDDTEGSAPRDGGIESERAGGAVPAPLP